MHRIISLILPEGFSDPQLSRWFPVEQTKSTPFAGAQRSTFRRASLSEEQIDYVRTLKAAGRLHYMDDYSDSTDDTLTEMLDAHPLKVPIQGTRVLEQKGCRAQFSEVFYRNTYAVFFQLYGRSHATSAIVPTDAWDDLFNLTLFHQGQQFRRCDLVVGEGCFMEVPVGVYDIRLLVKQEILFSVPALPSGLVYPELKRRNDGPTH